MNLFATEFNAVVTIKIYPVKLFASGRKPYTSAPNVWIIYGVIPKLMPNPTKKLIIVATILRTNCLLIFIIPQTNQFA